MNTNASRSSTERAAWVGASQAVSSLTNLSFSLVAIRSTSAEAFGAFALGTTVYFLAVSTGRAVAGDVFVLSGSHVAAEQRREVRRGVLRTMVVSVAAGVALAIFAFGPCPSDARFPIALLALAMPGALLQDYLRMVAIGRGCPSRAARSDLVWFVLLMTTAGVLWARTGVTLTTVVAAWAGGAAVAAVLAMSWEAKREDAEHGDRYEDPAPALYDSDGKLAAHLLLEHIVGNAGLYVGIGLVASVAGLAEVGTMRAAFLLASPVQLLFQTVQTAAVPELRRVYQQGGAIALRFKQLLALDLGAAIAISGAIVILPESLGIKIFSDKWVPARSILAPLVLYLVSEAAFVACRSALRATGAAQVPVRVRVAVLPITIIATAAGATAAGAYGALLGLALTSALSAAFVLRAAFARIGQTT